MPFVVRQVHPMAVVLSLLGVAATAVLVVLWSRLGPGDGGIPLVGFAVIAAAALGAWRRSRDSALRLRVDADAVTMPAAAGAGRVRGQLTVTPWTSVQEVVVVLAPSGTPMTLALRLAPGAPLPRSVKGRISDPDDPEADDEQLTAKIGDLRLDGGALSGALRTFSGGRTVTERRIERFAIGGAGTDR